MTREELTHIREVMDKEGYDVILHYISDELGKRQTLEIKKKDHLEGIEFVKWSLGNDYPIFRVLRCSNDSFDIYFNGMISTKTCKSGWVESTESAYVEQLKTKAHELYGEIKDGDRFEFTWIGDGIEQSIHLKGEYYFYYDKESDTLDINGFPLYKQGEWAKKVEGPVRVIVEPIHRSWDNNGNVSYDLSFSFKVTGTIVGNNNEIISKHLAKCLEDYLNKS